MDDQDFSPPEGRARGKLGFYRQAVVSLVLGLGLAGLDLATTRGRHWFWWPLAALALALALRAVKAFGKARFEDLEQRQAKEELDREERMRQVGDD